jgi:hypothetical protein
MRGRKALALAALLVGIGAAPAHAAPALLSFRRRGRRDACKAAGIDVTLRMRPGYDQSYYFVSTFMPDHIAWHAERLSA